jgi:DNA-binding LacI/PurR family transcriptional regulator/DNA-binding transcriptional regulator YhcF (GntR family)
MQDGNLKYQLIAKDILHRILSDKSLKDNDSFDSEYVLSDKYNTTRRTVRKAIEFLVNADVLYKLPKKGVYIKSIFAAQLYAKQFELHGNALFNFTQKKVKRDRIIVFGRSAFHLDSNSTDEMAPFSYLLCEAFSKFTQMYPCDVVFSPAHAAEELLTEASLKELRQYGLLYISPLAKEKAIISRLIKEGVNVILLANGPWPEGVNYVFSDERSAAKMAVDYLAELGHSRIVYFRQPSSVTSVLRAKGVIDSGIQNGIPKGHIQIIDSIHYDFSKFHQLLKGKNRPTVIIADYQKEYFLFLAAIQEHGLRVPEDISICTFDDTLFLNFQEIPVTAIRQPIEEIVFAGIQELLHLKNGSATAPIINETLQSKLIIRNSVAYAPGVMLAHAVNFA